MDERRRQLEAECGHDIHNHSAPPAKEKMETDVGTHSAQKTRRRDYFSDKPMVERRVQAVRGTEGEGCQGPSQREWQALQQQSQALETCKAGAFGDETGGTGT